MTVKPILGEIGRYYCQSRSNPDSVHLVDILEDQCGCSAFTFYQKRYTTRTGTPYRCAHLLAARHYALEDFIEVMKAEVANR